MTGKRLFPRDFIWGVATAALQIEGHSRAEGAGETVWERVCSRPGFIFNNDRLDRGTEHFVRWREDIRLMKEIGVQAYRFSINWARIFPEGRGKANQAGLDFYSALVDELLENGIQPWVTLFHWETPQALEERFGGWRSKETAYALADYAGYVCARLSDKVSRFFTINEISCFSGDAYTPSGNGMAPAVACSRKEMFQATHNACLAHGLALQAARANAAKPIKVGIAQNGWFVVPAIATEEHLLAASKAFRQLNANTMTLLHEGDYTEEFRQMAAGDMPDCTDDELKLISSPMDFLGLNIYTAQYVCADRNSPQGYRLFPWTDHFPRLAMPCNYIVPEALYYTPLLCHRLWGTGSIVISESGCAVEDRQELDTGEVNDIERINYLRSHLANLQQAIADEIPIHGYFLWSLLDNFEWRYGYSKRFGIIHTNHSTQERTPKLSARYYNSVISNRSAF